jgi:tripartite-type tricarboxylate transporter receptor subunit TctC
MRAWPTPPRSIWASPSSQKAGGGRWAPAWWSPARPAATPSGSSPPTRSPTGKLNFNPVEDLTHISRYGAYLYGLVVRSDSPWKTIQEFIQYSKQNPKKISFGSPDVGTPPHLAMEELAILAGGVQ